MLPSVRPCRPHTRLIPPGIAGYPFLLQRQSRVSRGSRRPVRLASSALAAAWSFASGPSDPPSRWAPYPSRLRSVPSWTGRSSPAREQHCRAHPAKVTAWARCMLCHHPLLETLGGVVFHQRRLSMERKSLDLTEAQQVGTLGIGDANPLPTLAGSHQGRVHKLQAAPLIEEARMILVRRRSSRKLRSIRFVIRTYFRWATGRRRWARLASRSSRSDAIAVG